MNILVIGNGFDLAHGLPTKYGDFLEFVDTVEEYYLKKRKNLKNDCKIEKYLEKGIKPEILEELVNCVQGNMWLDYFKKANIQTGWIDFERAISIAIQSMDNSISKVKTLVKSNRKGFSVNDRIGDFIDIIIEKFKLKPKIFYQYVISNEYRTDNILDIEYDIQIKEDLDKLIRALEIYLSEYVEKLDCGKVTPDIMNTSFDAILSFNYTHTYMKLYDSSGDCKYTYIHGETISAGSIQTNNMVLGIDEYLSDERKDKDVDFIVFKKYYQRIYKGTGCEYKKWLNQIQNKYVIYLENRDYCEEMWRKARQRGDFMAASKWSVEIQKIDEENEINNLYIFGHSLDVTDRDILRDLILHDNVYTTIYYYKTYDDNGKDDNGRIDLGTKVTNLVKVIGQDELIRRTGGSTKTIEFKLQQDMVEI